MHRNVTDPAIGTLDRAVRRRRNLALAAMGLVGILFGLVRTSFAEPPVTKVATDRLLTNDLGAYLGDLAQVRAGATQRASSANPDLAKNGDARSIAPGTTLEIANLTGPGIIRHIWCTTGSSDPFIGRALVLRIYWDDQESPSVEVPLGDFFGVGHGAAADFSSLPVAVSSHGRSRSCYWPMPFFRQAKITVTNESRTGATLYYYVDWEKHAHLPEQAAYFHAHYRQAFPAGPGDYTILDTTGRGHYVGTVLSVLHTKLGWFGEGDDRFWIDGEDSPRLRGTGTEDYFGDAWGFRPFAAPMHGVSLWEGNFPGDRGTAYRWHLADPVRFERSLKVTIEHKGSLFHESGLPLATFEERPDWLSSVAYWYQTPAAGPSAPMPPAAERLPPYRLVRPDELRAKAEPRLLLVQKEDGLTYAPRRGDAAIDLGFEVSQKGRYQLSAILVHSVFGSRYQAFLDGQPVGAELDLCYQGIDPIWVSLDLHDLDAGEHTLRFEGRGPSPHKRARAPAYFGFGVNALILLRLEDLAGYP